MSKKVAFLDLTPFYGGGQRFLLNVQSYAKCKEDFYFIVKDKKTYDHLDGKNRFLIPNSSLVGELVNINKYLKANNLDTVVFNGNRPIYLSPFIRGNIKIAYKHTSNNAFSLYKRFTGHILLNCCYLFVDRIVLLYEDAKNEVFINRSKVAVINNGVALQKPRAKSKNVPITVLCVSRLEEDKGIDWLVKVFYETFGAKENICLKIAGKGSEYDALDNFIISKGIQNIKLLGFVEDVQNELQEADIFVLPSKFEAFPLSILEAMSCGLPIIATKTGGVKEVVKEKLNGFLINFGKEKELKEALSKLVGSEELRQFQGENSIQLVKQKFEISKCVSKIENLINECNK